MDNLLHIAVEILFLSAGIFAAWAFISGIREILER